MRTTSLIIGFFLLAGHLSLGAATAKFSPEARAEQAALAAASQMADGLHVILVQDDGKHEPLASAIVSIKLSGVKNELNRRVVNGESKIEISGNGVVDSSRRHLMLNAVIEAKIDFGGARNVKGGTVGQFIIDRTEFRSEILPRGKPYILVVNSLTGSAEEHFSESAALVLLWK